LTSFVLNVNAQRALFPAAPERDNTVVSLMTGLTFNPLALLTGRVDVGILRFVGADASTPPYQGPAADVDLGYALLGKTRFGVHLGRSVGYSFDPKTPYLLQTDQSISVTHRFTDQWDATATANRSVLAYRELIGMQPTGNSVMSSLEGGVGYRLGRRIQLGIHLSRVERLAGSGSTVGDFRATRIFSSVAYGTR
jgi:hypothetical protein